MLPCVRSVIDHRMRQKSVTQGESRVCQCCSYHRLTSSVIYYWTGAQQHANCTWHFINKETMKINVNDIICASVLQWIISKNLSKCKNNLTYYTKEFCYCVKKTIGLFNNKTTSPSFLRADSERGAAELTIARRKRGRVV